MHFDQENRLNVCFAFVQNIGIFVQINTSD